MTVAMHYAVDQDQDVVAAAEQLMGDSWFGRHAYYMAQRHSAANNPTYLYFYERRPPATTKPSVLLMPGTESTIWRLYSLLANGCSRRRIV